ncbi:MAG: hypothetical protein GY760_28180 [Deltaproteobacteria bacterium]|nr:hypothetical protein [Deltaproteobacteria bacterium]
MFESIRKKIDEQNEKYGRKKISFDFKLMFVFHIMIMILAALRPIENPIFQVCLAISLAVVLIVISIKHKSKSNWSWPGLSFTSIPLFVLNLIFTCAFIVFSSFTMITGGDFPEISSLNIMSLLIELWKVVLKAASNPVDTPFFLGILGIFFMNSMVSLKLSALSKDDFEAQCNKNQYYESVKRFSSEIDFFKSEIENGRRPSEIVGNLHQRGIGMMYIVLIAREATGLGIAELKDFGQYWSDKGITDSNAFDKLAKKKIFSNNR